MPRIAYLDLAFVYFYEDYAIKPKRYGGGRIFASLLKEFDNFSIFADKECFNNLQNWENKKNCITTTPEQRTKIAVGYPIGEVLPEIHNFDILLHPHTSVHINTNGTKIKQVVWQLGIEENIHSYHDTLLLYNDYQRIKLGNPNTKIFKFCLGTEIPKYFQKQTKEDFIFQCSRHVSVFNTIEIAKFCNNRKIRCYFAGPIDPSYKLKDHIDNISTFYLGELEEDIKLHYTKRARLYTLIHNWPTPFSLSAVEALSLGTPVVCTPIGFWPSLIKPNVNGFFATNEEELYKAWIQAKDINQHDCYTSVLKHNHYSMIESLFDIFNKIHFTK